MAPPTRTSRDAWIEAATKALARGGPQEIRVETLAAELEITKGSFYGHFSDRSELLHAVLDHWETTSIDTVFEEVGRRHPQPSDRVRMAGALTFSEELLPVDLAVRSWARQDEAVAERLRRVDNRRMAYLREYFESVCATTAEVEARSLLAFSLAIGTHFLAADVVGRSREEVIRDAARLLGLG